jgi:hypothetical protein
MKLISIDIGIRNLAVCVLEGTSRKDVSISSWDVIDVLGEKNGVSRPSCFHCSKPGMWFQGEKYACTKHCPKVKVPTKTSLTKTKIEDLVKQGKDIGMVGLPTKKGELVNAVYEKYKSIGWSKFTGGASVKHAPVLDLAGDIANSLGSRNSWWEGANLVVIENQKDRRMFAVQSMIHMFFVLKGFKVKGVSAKRNKPLSASTIMGKAKIKSKKGDKLGLSIVGTNASGVTDLGKTLKFKKKGTYFVKLTVTRKAGTKMSRIFRVVVK